MSTLKLTMMSKPSQLTNGTVPSKWKVSTVGSVAEAGATSANGATASASTSKNRKRPLMPPSLWASEPLHRLRLPRTPGAPVIGVAHTSRLPQGRPTRRYAGPQGGSRAPNRAVRDRRVPSGTTRPEGECSYSGPSREPTHQEDQTPPARPPQLRQPPAAAAAALRRHVADSPDRETARALPPLGGVEPLDSRQGPQCPGGYSYCWLSPWWGVSGLSSSVQAVSPNHCSYCSGVQ